MEIRIAAFVPLPQSVIALTLVLESELDCALNLVTICYFYFFYVSLSENLIV